MIEDIYILWTLISFFLFFTGLTDFLQLERGTRLMMMILSVVMFFTMALTAFNIDTIFCYYSGSWSCNTHSVQDVTVAIMNFVFGALALLYVFLDIMGWIPYKKIQYKG